MAAEVFPKRLTIGQRHFEQLRALLAVVAANPFWRAKYEAAEAPNRISSVQDFTDRYPLTTKEELVADQAAHPPYGTNLTYPVERYTRCHQTSGTSGAPLRWLDTPESWNWMLENWIQILQRSRITSADRLFFAFSFGPFLGFWTAFEAALRMGCACFSSGGMSSGSRARALFDHRATVLCCTPTYALHLGEIAAAENLDLRTSPVKTLLVAGEPGGSVPSTRARLETLWPGARVVDHHGMTEVGPVSYACAARSGVLHVIESAYFAEIIDPQTMRAAERGQIGELILTTLGRQGSPLLRYRTGDLVKSSQDIVCECGSSDLALEDGILGRIDDMVVIRGVNVYPSALEDIMFSTGEVAEYRVTVNSAAALAELSVQVEPAPAALDTASLAARLESELHIALNLRVPVSLVAPGTLPRAEMKARRWITNVAPST